ncbi:MAG: hypothetical protein LUH21_07010 [Clostridiales bacterium]|nr:hypothetical protein [Clostridiales bacterium]
MQNKDSTLKIRCTYNQKCEIQHRAEKSGMTMSEYVIQTSLKSRNRIRTPKKDLINAITEVQISFNVLEHEIDDRNEEKIEEQLVQIRERLDHLWRIL